VDYLKQAAVASVALAFGVAILVIISVMAGLIVDPLKMLRVGATLLLALSASFSVKAHFAAEQDHASTNAWLYVAPRQRPPPAAAQRVISTLLRDEYLRFAQLAAGISAILSGAALLAPLFFQ
jgi:hypothetical protein